MQPHRNLKEINNFLGLRGYYQKFVLRIANISQPVTLLAKEDTPFEWTDVSWCFQFIEKASYLGTNSQIPQSGNTIYLIYTCQ